MSTRRDGAVSAARPQVPNKVGRLGRETEIEEEQVYSPG